MPRSSCSSTLTWRTRPSWRPAARSRRRRSRWVGGTSGCCPAVKGPGCVACSCQCCLQRLGVLCVCMQVAGVHQELQQLRADAAAAGHERRCLQQQLAEAQQARSAQDEALAQLQAQLAALQEELQRDRGTLATMLGQHQQREQQLEQVRAALVLSLRQQVLLASSLTHARDASACPHIAGAAHAGGCAAAAAKRGAAGQLPGAAGAAGRGERGGVCAARAACGLQDPGERVLLVCLVLCLVLRGCCVAPATPLLDVALEPAAYCLAVLGARVLTPMRPAVLCGRAHVRN